MSYERKYLQQNIDIPVKFINKGLKKKHRNSNNVNVLLNQEKESNKFKFKIVMDNNVLCCHILKYSMEFIKKTHCLGYSYGSKQQDFNIELMLPNGKHEITYEGEKLIIFSNTYFKPIAKYDSIDFYKQVIICNNNNFEILEKFIKSAKDFCETGGIDNVTCYIMTHGVWRKLSSQKKRSLDTIYLDNDIKENICNDLERFFKNEKRYNQLGIPYKRNYLFEGIPGTGKTSLILALASKYKMNIGIISLNKELDDYTFMKSISNIPKDTILVLEDIDGLFDEDKQNSLTFSGVLNTLDGLGRQDRLIIIMTTNHLNRLNNALKRAGRIDYKLHFDYCKPNQIRMMMNKFFEGEKFNVDAFIKNIKHIKLTPSILQYFLQKIVNEDISDINSKKNISLLSDISKEFIEDFQNSSMYI